ncbi:MAG: hypothetical protein IH899_17855, partial [Planctomycetes bacterium]|nr:hypothetical protein [Planctomycetota bacterium]
IILEQTTGWMDVRHALHAAKGKMGVVETLTRSVEHFQSLLTSGNFEFWFAETPAELPEYFPLWLRLVLPAAGVLIVTTFVCSVIWACWRPADWPLRLLVLWSLLPVLMLLLVRPKVYPHYVLVGFPVPFVLVGALCAGVIFRCGNRLWMVMTTLLMMILLSSLQFVSYQENTHSKLSSVQ